MLKKRILDDYLYKIRHIKPEKRNKIIKTATTVTIILVAVLFFAGNGNNQKSLEPAYMEPNAVSEIESKGVNTVHEQDNTDTENESEIETGKVNSKFGPEEVEQSIGSVIESDEIIICDISGAVKNPGVYELRSEDRLNDLIELAGGLLDDADINAINRARMLHDGEKIYIPLKNEIVNPKDIDYLNDLSTNSQEFENSQDGKININTAGLELLQNITGVGPVTAEKIIEYRNANGPFAEIDDIKNISGIGEKTFQKMKDNITF